MVEKRATRFKSDIRIKPDKKEPVRAETVIHLPRPLWPKLRNSVELIGDFNKPAAPSA